MFWLIIGIFIGIYADQTFTIPPLGEYFKLIKKLLEEGRKARLVNTTPKEVEKTE